MDEYIIYDVCRRYCIYFIVKIVKMYFEEIRYDNYCIYKGFIILREKSK